MVLFWDMENVNFNYIVHNLYLIDPISEITIQIEKIVKSIVTHTTAKTNCLILSNKIFVFFTSIFQIFRKHFFYIGIFVKNIVKNPII